jgi:urease accessory protein
MTSARTLLLIDSRLPTGAHAHSGGMEAAVAAGTVLDLGSLRAFLAGRLATTGLVNAAVAAAVAARCARMDRVALGLLWPEIDREVDARTPSPAQRIVSRRQGAQLLRAAKPFLAGPIVQSLMAWPSKEGAHHCVVLGALAGASDTAAGDIAVVAAYQSVAGPASAALRLLGLDPIAVAALLGDLAPAVDRTAREAGCFSSLALSELPARAAPSLDLLAEVHAQRKERLFAS